MDRHRTTRKVTFRHSFWLSGFEQPQPAGSYTIGTEEEPPDRLSITAWQNVPTTIRLCRYGTSEHVSIDAKELRDVLLRDGDRSLDPPAASAATGDWTNNLRAGDL